VLAKAKVFLALFGWKSPRIGDTRHGIGAYAFTAIFVILLVTSPSLNYRGM
jgi:hypothetical protein